MKHEKKHTKKLGNTDILTSATTILNAKNPNRIMQLLRDSA